MALNTARIITVSKDDAEAFMQAFEHLGNVGLGVWHYGMLLQEKLACVLSFGVPCFSIHRGFLGELARKHKVRVLQLCRGGTADWAPKNTPSKAISLTLEVIERELGSSLVVAYADPHFAEVGTIYQACNAIHTGWTDPKGQANYILNGQPMSGWVVRKRYGTRNRQSLRKIDPYLIIRPLRPKIRYVLVAASTPRKARILKDLLALHRPYPKRAELKIPSMRSP